MKRPAIVIAFCYGHAHEVAPMTPERETAQAAIVRAGLARIARTETKGGRVMAEEYTPTDDEIRAAATRIGWWRPEAYDRWLAAHDAQVKAEAWDEGELAGVANQQAWDGWRYAKGFPLPNPYRAAETEATR